MNRLQTNAKKKKIITITSKPWSENISMLLKEFKLKEALKSSWLTETLGFRNVVNKTSRMFQIPLNYAQN